MTHYPEDLDQWREASRIAARARELGLKLAVPGAKRREVADSIESFIRREGAEPAFPANLSRNNEAAHFTPSPDDEATFVEGDLVKVDVGAHLDGAISDTAMTVEVGGGHRYESLVLAVRDAVEAGISRVRAGVTVDEISRGIEAAIHARGLKPVHNLTGHTIERYLLHAGKAIPNVSGMSSDRLEEGEVVAIEPFATNGAGAIENGEFGNIVRFRRDPGTSDPPVARLYARFRTLPFTSRWVGPADLASLSRGRRLLQAYPVFMEEAGGWVAQAEHTVLVLPDRGEVLTRAPE
jgi:methionyl aminopeptidase